MQKIDEFLFFHHCPMCFRSRPRLQQLLHYNFHFQDGLSQKCVIAVDRINQSLRIAFELKSCSILIKHAWVEVTFNTLYSRSLASRRIVGITTSVTRLGDFLPFGQPFEASVNNYFTQIAYIVRQFL